MSGVETEREKLFDHASAASLFSELAFEKESKIFYMEDGMLGFVFEMPPLTAADQSTLDQVIGALGQNWPVGSFLQMSLISSPDLERQIHSMLSMRDPQDEILYKAMEQRAAFLRQGTGESIGAPGGPLVRNQRLILSAKIPCDDPPTPKNLKEVAGIRTAVKGALSGGGFNPTDLDAAEYARLMQSILNWGSDASWRKRKTSEIYNEAQILREQFLDGNNYIENGAGGFKLGEKHVRTLSVKQYPEYVNLSIPSSYVADPKHGAQGIMGSFMITASVHFPDSEKKREMMSSKRNWLIKQAQGPMLKFVPRLAQQYYSFEALFEALDDGDDILDFNLSIALFADSEDEINEATSNAKTYYRKLNLQMLEDRFFHLPIFLNALPLGADKAALKTMNRYTTMTSRHAARLIPFLADWKGTWTPTMQFVSRTGQLMNMDLYDSDTNFNGVIAAQSGAGKSFLTNEIIVSYLSTGNQAWVIDVGRSYEKLCEALGGTFMVFSDDSDICMNPFDVIQDFQEELGMLVGLLTAMAAPNETMSDFQKAIIRKVLGELWETHGRDMTIDTVADHLIEEGKKENEKRISDFGVQLFPFTSKGEFGRWFNGKNNLSIGESNFVVLELEELKAKPELQQVVLLQLIQQIQFEMYLGDRNKRKLLLIDEAWSLLSSNGIAEFIETGYRRFRKYGGSAITITQSVNDLYANKTGVAIVENSSNMYLLKQKGQTIDQVKKDERLPLTPAGYDLLKTVHTKKGMYSEIFFMTEGGAGIGRLIVNRFQQLLYSTQHEEVQAIKEYQQKGLNLTQAIERIIQDEERQRQSAALAKAG